MARCLLAVVGVLSAVCVAGCVQLTVRSIDRLSGAAINEPFPDASVAQWPADFKRLVYDIPRAVKKHHWGMLGLKQHGPEGGDTETEASERIIRAAALLPDGRSATIVAWPEDETTIAVALRVGPFGDALQEEAFLVRLAQVMRGKPSRRHRQEFELP